MLEIAYPEVVQYERVETPGDVWNWIKPDTLNLLWNYQVRPSAPAPCVFTVGSADNQWQYETPIYSHSVPFTEDWQWFAADLLSLSKYKRHYVDLIRAEQDYIKSKFTALYGNTLAFANGTGFPGRANYVKGEDLDCEVPRLDKVRRCGTDSFKGTVVENATGREVIRLDTFDYYEGPPEDYGVEILNDPRVGYATNIYANGAVGNFPTLGGALVPVPTVALEPVHFPRNCCTEYSGPRGLIGWTP